MFLEFEENEWELLFCSSFLIGAKCHELDKNLPALIEIVYTMNASEILKGSISKKFKKITQCEIVNLEQQILNALQFDVNHVLPFDFCETLMSIGIMFDGD